MAIWTSRYSNKELVENKDKYYCVGISLGTPKFPLGYTVEQQCYSLAPKGYMLEQAYIEGDNGKLAENYYLTQIVQNGNQTNIQGGNNYKIADRI